MEAGTHSIWVSEQLQELGHEVIVANFRELRAISHSDRSLAKGSIQMSKDVETRLKETIQFIRNHSPQNFVGDLGLIIRNLNTWYATASPATRRRLSLLMSQQNAPNRPQNQTDRSYRRACILLRCALLDPETGWVNWATRVNNIVTNFDGSYDIALGECRDRVYSSPGVAGENLKLLKTHTTQFLNQFKLLVTGKSESRRCSYGFYMQYGNYNLDCTGRHDARVTVDAINVPATKFAKVQNNLGHIQPTVSSMDNSCDLMLTTQFTGCCYCFMVNGASLAAAHIDPGLGTKIRGQDVSQQLQANGGFSNDIGGTFRAYGRVDPGPNVFGYPPNAQQMTILAVKQSGAWCIYSQIDMGTHLDVSRIV